MGHILIGHTPSYQQLRSSAQSQTAEFRLKDIQEQKRFELVALSGTSAGALCALMVGYGLASKNGRQGSEQEAIEKINSFWDGFAATEPAEIMHNAFSGVVLSAQEQEVPVLRINMPIFGINPAGFFDEAILQGLHQMGARKEYYDWDAMLAAACPEFDAIDWPQAPVRVLLGASEIVQGVETVLDSSVIDALVKHPWCARRPLTLQGAAASGTLPSVREAQRITVDNQHFYYWDGLYSQNPPAREFVADFPKERRPDEIWVVRINPQQRPDGEPPNSTADIRDRENELMGNLSLNKELNFIETVNDWIRKYGGSFAEKYKPVTVRTIKMTRETATELRTSAKFDRSRSFIDKLRKEGEEVGNAWLKGWPYQGDNDGRFCYPNDAAYY
jgi:NTE family protein